jgi:hypothetical protein
MYVLPLEPVTSRKSKTASHAISCFHRNSQFRLQSTNFDEHLHSERKLKTDDSPRPKNGKKWPTLLRIRRFESKYELAQLADSTVQLQTR